MLYIKHNLSIHFELNVEINKLKDYMSYQARITSEPLAFLGVLRIYYITVNSFPRIIICGSEINSQRTWK